MRKAKRWTAFALTGVLAVTALAGCGSSQSDGEKKEAKGGDKQLTVSWWGNQVRNEGTQKALDLFAEENPGVTFDGQFSEGADYWNKLATSAAGGNLPDVIQMDYAYLDQYASSDQLLDLTPYIENGDINVENCDEGVLNSGKVGDKLYALCIGVNAPALLYNKTLLEDNRIEIKDNMTTDEFIDVCREVYEKTGYKTNISYGISVQYLECWLRGEGIPLFEDGKLGGDSSKPYEEYFKIYEEGITEGWHIESSVYAERTVGAPEQDTLVYGSGPDTRSWCAFVYSNQLSAYKNAAPDDMEIGITTWPSDDPLKSNYLKPSQFFSISKDTENVEEAIKLLDFWTNSVECNEILLGERGVPLSSEVSEAILPKLDENGQLVTSYINDVVTPNSSPIDPPYPDGSSEVTDTYWKLLEQICYGEISAEEAGKQLYEEGNKILASKAE